MGFTPGSCPFSQRLRQVVPDTSVSVNGAAQGVPRALRLRWAKVGPKRHQSWFLPQKTNFDAKGKGDCKEFNGGRAAVGGSARRTLDVGCAGRFGCADVAPPFSVLVKPWAATK